MAKPGKEDMSLAEALAELHGKPEGDKKQEPEIKTDRGPMEEIHFAEALAELHGKPEGDKKQEPEIKTDRGPQDRGDSGVRGR